MNRVPAGQKASCLDLQGVQMDPLCQNLRLLERHASAATTAPRSRWSARHKTRENPMKRVIRIGDRTSHGGRVVTGCDSYLIHGRPVARVGDQEITSREFLRAYQS